MESPQSDNRPAPLNFPNPANPFRKSFINSKSSKSEIASPASAGTKKLTVLSSFKQQPDQSPLKSDRDHPLSARRKKQSYSVKEGIFVQTQADMGERKSVSGVHVDGFESHMAIDGSPTKNQQFSDAIKFTEGGARTTTNARNSEDLLTLEAVSPTRSVYSRSKTKLYTAENSRQQSKEGERDGRRSNQNTDESFENESSSKMNTKQSSSNPAGQDRDSCEEDEAENEENGSNNEENNAGFFTQQSSAVNKIKIKPKPKYDPYAVLNKVRSKKFFSSTAGGRLTGRNARNDSPDEDEPRASQPRDFTVLRSKKMNLFEGIPYVPYDVFLRQDSSMQNVMVKDLLKILYDKAKSLKNLLHDGYRMERVMRNIEEAEQSALNLHTEETIGLINAVASLIMQEFRDSIDKIGIKPSPIFDNPDLKLTGFRNEIERFTDNCQVYLDTLDHLRDCIDCYYVMSRQKDRKPMADVDCSDLLQFVSRARYNLGQLYEAFRVIEKHVDAKLTWENENDPNRAKRIKQNDQKPNKIKTDTYKLLNELLHNKFNINKNKSAATRESKVILNQEAEDEKFLMILQNQKQLKKKNGKNLGDNRKLIILNRLLNPIEDPQIHAAMKVAQEKTNVQLSRDLVEYMASKARNPDHKPKTENDAPLRKNLEKILSNKKLTHMCFDYTDNKECQDALDKVSGKNKTVENKEVLSSIFSHTKTKRHFGCLFDGEALKTNTGQFIEPASSKGFKLPKLTRPHRK